MDKGQGTSGWMLLVGHQLVRKNFGPEKLRGSSKGELNGPDGDDTNTTFSFLNVDINEFPSLRVVNSRDSFLCYLYRVSTIGILF